MWGPVAVATKTALGAPLSQRFVVCIVVGPALPPAPRLTEPLDPIPLPVTAAPQGAADRKPGR